MFLFNETKNSTFMDFQKKRKVFSRPIKSKNYLRLCEKFSRVIAQSDIFSILQN